MIKINKFMNSRIGIFFKALKNRELLQPRLYFKKFNEIDITFLKEKGIKAIGIDKDNTITLPEVNEVSSQVDLSILKKEFNLAIFSNTSGSTNFELEKLDGIPIINHRTKKPLGN
jgi:predicted HAD superfamily phosphohydrolase YqeG